MKPKKQFGQNFLVDPEAVGALVAAGELTPKDTVLEIGPGLGTVSQDLVTQVNKLIMVELDADLIPNLTKLFSQNLKAELIHQDALKFLTTIEETHPGINKIVSSLPYQITSPLLHELVMHKKQIKHTALLIQKEVAERITAKAPKSNYMATFLNTFFDIELVSIVDKNAFDPIPQVDGAIVIIKALKKPLIKDSQIQKYSKFLHHGFGQQRKMLNKRFEPIILMRVGINSARRAESLTIQEWVKLFEVTSQ